MTSEELAIVLTARFDQVDKALTHVETGVQDYAKKVEGASKLVTAAFGLTELSIIGAVAAIGEFYRESLKAAEEEERLNFVLNMTAAAAGLTADSVKEAKEQIGKLNVTDNEAADVLAKLIRANVSLADSVKLSTAAQDIALSRGAKFGEVMAAIERAVEVQNGRMLRQYGILINNAKAFALYASAHGKLVVSLSEEEKRQAIVNEIMNKASAYTDAHTKALETQTYKAEELRVEWEKLKDEVGEGLLPAKKGFTDFLTGTIKSFRDFRKENRELSDDFDRRAMNYIPKTSSAENAQYGTSKYGNPAAAADLLRKQDEMAAKQQANFATIMRLTEVEHNYVLKGLDLEIAKIDEKRAKELHSAEDTVADEQAKNQLIKEINATADLEIQEAKSNVKKMDTQETIAYLKNLEKLYREHGKNVVAIQRAIKEQQENAAKEAAEKTKQVWQGFADYFAGSFANSVNIFQQQSRLLETAFENTINHMVQVLIQSAILSLIGMIFGIPGLGNLFGAGGFMGLGGGGGGNPSSGGSGASGGYDDVSNDRLAYAMGQTKWKQDFDKNLSKGYVAQSLMDAKNAPSMGGGSVVNENHFHYSPGLSMGNPSEIRRAVTHFFTVAKRQGVTS